MNTPIQQPAGESGWNAVLSDYLERMRLLHRQPELGRRALGVAGWDWRLWRAGREWLRQNPVAPGPAPATAGGDVYLATQIYAQGGHTALIGDFVRVLDGAGGGNSHVIVTNIIGHNKQSVAENIRHRLGVPPGNIVVLDGPSPAGRMEQLFRLLLALQPRRLFLFHHPEDPLACVVAHPDCAPERILVHHADGTPSFGLYLPGIRLIELNPIAAAMSRLAGLDPAWLPLTSPDPGPRPVGFLARGNLVTASSGTQYKFTRPHPYGYAETLGRVLQTTGGWHLHVGPLDGEILAGIHQALDRANVAADRFIHVPWAPSLVNCLWEHGCDLYLSSFPVDGARTNIEVFASATPHLRHTTKPDDPWIDGGLTWQTWDDLADTLGAMASRDALAERSLRMRAAYDQYHHPHAFANCLHDILATGTGRDDPREDTWDARVLRSMIKSLTSSLVKQAGRMEVLEAEVMRMRAESGGQARARGIRATLRKWLAGPSADG